MLFFVKQKIEKRKFVLFWDTKDTIPCSSFKSFIPKQIQHSVSLKKIQKYKKIFSAPQSLYYKKVYKKIKEKFTPYGFIIK